MIREANNAPFSQRQLRVGELIKQSLGPNFFKRRSKTSNFRNKKYNCYRSKNEPRFKKC